MRYGSDARVGWGMSVRILPDGFFGILMPRSIWCRPSDHVCRRKVRSLLARSCFGLGRMFLASTTHGAQLALFFFLFKTQLVSRPASFHVFSYLLKLRSALTPNKHGHRNALDSFASLSDTLPLCFCDSFVINLLSYERIFPGQFCFL